MDSRLFARSPTITQSICLLICSVLHTSVNVSVDWYALGLPTDVPTAIAGCMWGTRDVWQVQGGKPW